MYCVAVLPVNLLESVVDRLAFEIDGDDDDAAKLFLILAYLSSNVWLARKKSSTS